MLNAVYDKGAWLMEREIDASWPAAGLPETVHLDNGADFRSHAFAWACREEGIKLHFPVQPAEVLILPLNPLVPEAPTPAFTATPQLLSLSSLAPRRKAIWTLPRLPE